MNLNLERLFILADTEEISDAGTHRDDSRTEGDLQPSTRDYIRLQVPSHPRYVALLRDLVYQLCRRHKFSVDVAYDLKIITGEALTNIIKHAYDDRTDRPIFIEVYIFNTYIEIRFRDLGKRRPISPNLARDLSDYREGGLGIYLIGKLSDYHYYDQTEDVGTRLIIKKRMN